MQKIVTFALATLCLALPACDAPEDDATDAEFRGYAFPADNDIQVHVGTTTTDPDCLAWDIVDTDFYEGPQTLGNLLWDTTGLGDEIFDADGELLCTMHWAGWDYIELREGASGPVVASQWHNHAFYGDVSGIPESIRWDFADYTYNGTQIAEGPWYGPKVATATEFIEYAQTKRKMAVAALVMGVCGSNGLPPLPTP